MVEGRAVASALVFRAFLPPHPGPTALELGESTALFSLSSDGGGGEGRGEESRFYWISPLPNPPPARCSQGEGERRSAFQCLIQWQCTPPLSPRRARTARRASQDPDRPASRQRAMRCSLSRREGLPLNPRATPSPAP